MHIVSLPPHTGDGCLPQAHPQGQEERGKQERTHRPVEGTHRLLVRQLRAGGVACGTVPGCCFFAVLQYRLASHGWLLCTAGTTHTAGWWWSWSCACDNNRLTIDTRVTHTHTAQVPTIHEFLKDKLDLSSSASSSGASSSSSKNASKKKKKAPATATS